jgi:uncharacterized phage protein (TIGR02220 family)
MNDPAVLLYTSDFLTGVIDMTMEERGQYITLLCYQHQKGHIEEKTIRLLVGIASDSVMKHFIKDEEGKYYNKRMDLEKEKRYNFVESRRENAKKGGRPKNKIKKPSGYASGKHKVILMGNDNDNDNDNDNIIKIIDYLNLKTNSSYKSTTPKTRELIKARYNEGFNIDDFKQVIDNKVNAWGKDKKMSIYLRPETLFSNKFEGYLNEKTKKTTKDLDIDISNF